MCCGVRGGWGIAIIMLSPDGPGLCARRSRHGARWGGVGSAWRRRNTLIRDCDPARGAGSSWRACRGPCALCVDRRSRSVCTQARTGQWHRRSTVRERVFGGDSWGGARARRENFFLQTCPRPSSPLHAPPSTRRRARVRPLAVTWCALFANRGAAQLMTHRARWR